MTYVIKELDLLGVINCGKSALCAFLKEISQNVGHDTHEKFNQIILELQGTHIQPNLLFDLILDIDFNEQVEFVDNIMKSHRIAAFLVHGKADYGQDLLVTQLVRLTSTWRNNQPIRNDVTNRTASISFDSLRKQLARSFLLPLNTPISVIIEKICERWQTKDVIIIFDKVNFMPPCILSEWLHNFWHPLVELSTQNTPVKETYLLMFLVDNYEDDSKLNALITLNNLHLNQFYQLPAVNPFSEDILNKWIRNVKMKSSIKIPDTLDAQILLEEPCNGIPSLVCDKIYEKFGYDWEGEWAAKWLI
ncbi:XRE family transcriptional regulator [Dolichospermum sp. LEGE 00246]|nr:XRE family transcriptional regulator [Dolichospermum sp. LEGE 00246]